MSGSCTRLTVQNGQRWLLTNVVLIRLIGKELQERMEFGMLLILLQLQIQCHRVHRIPRLTLDNRLFLYFYQGFRGAYLLNVRHLQKL